MRLFFLCAIMAVVAFAAGCGGGGAPGGRKTASQDGLTPEQLENGIGPVTKITLDKLDTTLTAQGKALFDRKCSGCHMMDQRYVGPALGDVLDRRTPAYVMNMILAPEEMLSRHPEAKKLMDDYMTAMPNLKLSEAQARSVVEYFRAYQHPAGE